MLHVQLHPVLLLLSDLLHREGLHLFGGRPVPRRRDFGFLLSDFVVLFFLLFLDGLGLLQLAVQNCNSDGRTFQRTDVVSSVPSHRSAESEFVDHSDDEVLLKRRSPSEHVNVEDQVRQRLGIHDCLESVKVFASQSENILLRHFFDRTDIEVLEISRTYQLVVIVGPDEQLLVIVNFSECSMFCLTFIVLFT